MLVVAGDVEPDEVRALAEEHYGPIPAAGLPERARPQEPPQLAERRLRYEDARVGQPYVIRTYLAPERDAGDQREAAALTLLAEVLGGSPATSVLARKLQFESQDALYTAAFYDGISLDDATFGLAIVPAAGLTLEEGEAALDRAVAEFLEEGIDPAQLDRIKMQLRASRVYAADDVGSRARLYGSALTSGLTVEDVQEWPALLQDVTEAEILDAAALLLDRERARDGLPDDAGPRPRPGARGRAAPHPCRGGRRGHGHRPERGGVVMGVRLRSLAAGALALLALAGPLRAEIAIEEVTSPGGIDAWLVEEPSLPFVALELRFMGGASLDAPEARGAVNLMAGLLEGGRGRARRERLRRRARGAGRALRLRRRPGCGCRSRRAS